MKHMWRPFSLLKIPYDFSVCSLVLVFWRFVILLPCMPTCGMPRTVCCCCNISKIVFVSSLPESGCKVIPLFPFHQTKLKEKTSIVDNLTIVDILCSNVSYNYGKKAITPIKRQSVYIKKEGKDQVSPLPLSKRKYYSAFFSSVAATASAAGSAAALLRERRVLAFFTVFAMFSS